MNGGVVHICSNKLVSRSSMSTGSSGRLTRLHRSFPGPVCPETHLAAIVASEIAACEILTFADDGYREGE